MRVSELSGALLDLWVAKAKGDREAQIVGAEEHERCEYRFGSQWPWNRYSPSTAWMDGGPLIESDMIYLEPPCRKHFNGGPNAGWRDFPYWSATVSARTRTWSTGPDDAANMVGGRVGRGTGETPLIAAMRAKVASHYGEEVPE